jgi:hypothetical protein
MIYALLVQGQPTLVVLGDLYPNFLTFLRGCSLLSDAVASFLERQDSTTTKFPLLSGETIGTIWHKEAESQRWDPARYFWFKSVSLARWALTLIVLVVPLSNSLL